MTANSISIDVALTGGEVYVNPYGTTFMTPALGYMVNIVDEDGYVYRSIPMIVGKNSADEDLTPDHTYSITGTTYGSMFSSLCEYTLDTNVGSTDFVYLDSPGAQSFQLFDTT